MVRNPALVSAVEDAGKAQWLSRLTLEEAFRLAGDMDRFSRAMAPESFRLPTDDASLRNDPHVLMRLRMQAAFRDVRSPAG